jgi:hypothetical protein
MDPKPLRQRRNHRAGNRADYQVGIDGVTTVEFVFEVHISESCVSHQLGLASEALAENAAHPQTRFNTVSEPPGIVVVPPAQFVIESKVYLPWGSGAFVERDADGFSWLK